MHLVQTMGYVNETPWHGLGNQLTPNQPLEVWAKQAGMDWTIESSAVRFAADMMSDATHLFADQKVLYRSDTKTPLSIVSNRYQIVQPADVLEFYRDLTEVGGYQLETAGVLKEGRKFWALARTGQSMILKGGDMVNGYLLLATACDGTLATTAQFTSVRVVCNNTLAIALNDSVGAIKVPHRSQFDAQVVKRQLGIAVSSWDAFMARTKTLSECKVSDAAAKAFIQRVFANPAVAAEEAGQPTVNERALRAVQHLYTGNGKGAMLSSSAGTAWGLLNSVTEFVDHHRRARSDDNRRDAAWFGQGATLKQKAWEEALKLVA